MLNSRPKTNLINKLLYYLVAFTGILIAVVVVFGHILTPLAREANPTKECYSYADPFHATLYNILTPLSVLLVAFLIGAFLFRQFNDLVQRIVILTILVMAGLFGMVLIFGGSTRTIDGTVAYAKDQAGIVYCAEVKGFYGRSEYVGDLNVFKCENLKCQLIKTIENVTVGRFQFKQATDGSQTLVEGTKVIYP